MLSRDVVGTKEPFGMQTFPFSPPLDLPFYLWQIPITQKEKCFAYSNTDIEQSSNKKEQTRNLNFPIQSHNNKEKC